MQETEPTISNSQVLKDSTVISLKPRPKTINLLAKSPFSPLIHTITTDMMTSSIEALAKQDMSHMEAESSLMSLIRTQTGSLLMLIKLLIQTARKSIRLTLKNEF